MKNNHRHLRVLVLDPGAEELHPLVEAFAGQCGDLGAVEIARTVDDLVAAVAGKDDPDLVVIDYRIGDGHFGGLEALEKMREADPEVPTVMTAERGDVDMAKEAVAAGANDFLVRGHDLGERVATQMRKIKKLVSLRDKSRALTKHCQSLEEAQSARYKIVGVSGEIKAVIGKVEKVAKVPRPVLIIGERGTGKELVARAIHAASGADGKPFVTVNCAAFPDTLLENELFGHERGAFTGAEAAVPGKFEQADGGTLFLDEIGNMSVPFQQKILRVVEYGAFNRVGGSREVNVKTRIIAATNTDLRRAMDDGRFLRDLYDRLSFEVIRVPPLRERKDDIEVLSTFFLEQFMREVPAFQGKKLAPEALDILKGYTFPGNVRELKNIIERAVYRDTTNELNPEDIDMLPGPCVSPTIGDWQDRVESFERGMLEKAMKDASNNQAQAARSLGLSYHKFRYYFRKYFKGEGKEMEG